MKDYITLFSASSFNISNNNNTLNINKKDEIKCDIFSSFGFYVQITLAIISFLFLICKFN
jgi:hypothetical protein